MATGTYPIPHLAMASMGRVGPFEEIILQNISKIEHWFSKQWQLTPALMTVSVDLRHSGYKLAPIDTNLFPAGYNNLNPELMSLCVLAAQNAMHTSYPDCEMVLIHPESHTRNIYYAKSLAVLKDIWSKAGYQVRVGGEQEVGNACLILLNNDLSDGVPEWLINQVKSVEPPLSLGWSTRKKSYHFNNYAEVCQQFAKLLSIDPWFFSPLFSSATPVDFMSKMGLEAVAEKVDILINAIQEKYNQYQITEKPFVVVKADNGTYGMNVMMVFSGQEVLHLNRKQRTKMSVSKGKQMVQSVLIQEGVYSHETMPEGSVAEPVVYLIGASVVGGFYRIHETRSAYENLNTPGMHFKPLAFTDACNLPSPEIKISSTNRFYVYGVIARLAALAAARERSGVYRG